MQGTQNSLMDNSNNTQNLKDHKFYSKKKGNILLNLHNSTHSPLNRKNNLFLPEIISSFLEIDFRVKFSRKDFFKINAKKMIQKSSISRT
jgi:hypothetical protein